MFKKLSYSLRSVICVRLRSITKTSEHWSQLNAAKVEPVLVFLQPSLVAYPSYQALAWDVGADVQLLEAEPQPRTSVASNILAGA